MDFGTLLTVAQKNETSSKQPTACYQTKFAPPKKQSKQTKSLSDNIKKFLARKEEEERRKSLEEKKKRENLLALRDHKAQTRINKHLKVCKAANKSVLADAVDNENTALTMAGPSQPDEDDYGYVSQEASAFYNQLMRKYTNAPPEKPLFATSTKRSSKDIATTKDRVKQALRQQEIEEALGHRKKRKKEAEPEPVEKPKETQQPAKRKSAAPIGFGELLKIAEVKQHEPIVIQAKPKIEEPERLMTKRQMREFAKEREWRERKESREKDKSGRLKESSKTSKVPVVKEAPTKSGKAKVEPSSTAKVTKKEQETLAEERKMLEAEKKKIEEMRKALEEERKKLEESKDKKVKMAKTKQTEKQPVAKPVRVSAPKKPPPPKPLKPRYQVPAREPLADMDDEYDSELDDFIDDAAEEASEDYSKYISEIFGYDKSKYRNIDTGDDDAMESSFAQQLKEEYVSTKIGIMEDLEDIRMEALEKKRKALMRKKVK